MRQFNLILQRLIQRFFEIRDLLDIFPKKTVHKTILVGDLSSGGFSTFTCSTRALENSTGLQFLSMLPWFCGLHFAL